VYNGNEAKTMKDFLNMLKKITSCWLANNLVVKARNKINFHFSMLTSNSVHCDKRLQENCIIAYENDGIHIIINDSRLSAKRDSEHNIVPIFNWRSKQHLWSELYFLYYYIFQNNTIVYIVYIIVILLMHTV
jgi:hypothetical protein